MSQPTGSGPACCPSGLGSPMPRSNAVALASLFKAIADPTRLQILSLISCSEAGELCACELYEPLSLSQPTISHHTRILHDAGVLNREARGTEAWYSIRQEALDQLASVLKLTTASDPMTVLEQR